MTSMPVRCVLHIMRVLPMLPEMKSSSKSKEVCVCVHEPAPVPIRYVQAHKQGVQGAARITAPMFCRAFYMPGSVTVAGRRENCCAFVLRNNLHARQRNSCRVPWASLASASPKHSGCNLL